MARALMEAGANAKAFTYKGENTLHFAAAGGDLKLVELLLKKKVNPRAASKKGKTPKDVAKDAAIVAALGAGPRSPSLSTLT